MSLTSLHYYFPWAIKALVKWCIFVLLTDRRGQLHMEDDRDFSIAGEGGGSCQEKRGASRPLADAYFDSGRYQDFWAGKQAQLDDIVLDWVAGPAFDELLIQTVKSVYPAHEHDKFIAHLRGLLGLWVRDETARLAAA